MLALTESVVEDAVRRDILLPKLISGELCLPAALRDRAAQAGGNDVERLIGGAV